ncbi:MAG: ATP-binding protein [Candidatus Didemnitutus sp.]|nr:ATP-binding protein [Candidatus Didemnitutus sp.]
MTNSPSTPSANDKPNPTDELTELKIAALSDVAGHLAHDFNNLLAAISGSATLIEMSGAAPEASRHVNNIKIATQRAAKVMSQLLALSARADCPFETLAVSALLNEATVAAKATLGHSHFVSFLTADNLPPISVDQSQMVQVLGALIENARDAMLGGGTILLTAHCPPPAEGTDRRFVAITVQDSGSGMTPEVRARIFEPFFTTKAKSKGTGLGLSIALRSINRHGGSIEVASEAGKGTQVTCFLPAAADLPK